MKFGSYNASPWIRFHGGWYLPLIGSGNALFACYHGMYEVDDIECKVVHKLRDLKLCEENIYRKGKSFMWNVELHYNAREFQKAFDSFYDKKPMTEDEIKVVVENFLERINKLTAFF